MLEEQLAAQLQQRAGLGEESARQAARVALDFVKEKLPQAAPLMDAAERGGIGQGLGGLLGG